MIWIKGVETNVVRVSVNGHIYGVYNPCKCKWFTLTHQFFIHLHLHLACTFLFYIYTFMWVMSKKYTCIYMTLCKKSRSCNIRVNILGVGGELLVCATTPSFAFVVRRCHWSSPSSFFMSSSSEQVVILTLQGLVPIIVWCSCLCDGWCYVLSCSPLSFFMCRKLEWWSPILVVVTTITKDLQVFVAIVLFRWAMSCLDPTLWFFLLVHIFFKAMKL
jgi:hypothetical protein